MSKDNKVEPPNVEAGGPTAATTVPLTSAATPAAADSADEAKSDQLMVSPGDWVPQSNRYTRKNIFIRECYPDYYDKVLETLKTNKRLVTVTGTPGIGKSLFYLYFLAKYREQYPDQRVLTASFTELRDFKQCVVWKSLNEVKATHPHANHEAYEEYQVYARHTSIPPWVPNCALFLYDGPPTAEPQVPNKMVCFTCPNNEWMGIVGRYEEHLSVYMPNWTRMELEEACILLKLGLKPPELQQKESLFGGTARYTLTNDPTFFNTGKADLNTALSKINSFEDVQKCFEGIMELRLVVHRLMHYFVDPNDWTKAKLKPASKVVAAMIHDRLIAKLDSDRATLLHWLEGANKATVFSGWLFENLAHEKLSEGGEFPMRSLQDAKVDILKLKKTVGLYKRFKLQCPLEEALLNSLQIPEAANLQSVDSYYQDEDENMVYLFQVTRNVVHEVDLEGLVKILEFLKLKDQVMQDTNKAALVFVVPMPMRDDYKVQKISKPPVFESKDRNVMMGMGCDQMPGVGTGKKRKLDDMGVYTIGKLMEEYGKDSQKFSFIDYYVKKFQSNVTTLDEAKKLEGIPQFVIGIPYRNEDVGK